MKKEIFEICNRVPIKLKTAKKLLKKTDYNIDKAVIMWKENLELLLIKKLSIKDKTAKKLLEDVDYNFAKALSIYNKKNKTDIEKILNYSKKKEEILSNFWVFIIDKYNVDINGGWITKSSLQKIPQPIRDILTIWQWYAYYNYEGISVEQLDTNNFIKIIEFKFGFSNFAKDLKRLKEIITKFNKKNSSEKNFEKYIELKNKLISSKTFREIDNKIKKKEKIITEKLYEYLYNNSKKIDEILNNYKKLYNNEFIDSLH